MKIDALIANATDAGKRFQGFVTKTLNDANTFVIDGVQGISKVTQNTAHGTLHVAEAAFDLAYKSTLIASPFASVVLMVDAYAFSKGISPFTNRCGTSVPILALSRAELTYDSQGSVDCKDGITQDEIKGLSPIQALIGASLLTVATPIAAMTFRKINHLIVKLNNSF